MAKCLSSFQELDLLGAGLSRDYLKKTHRWNALCFDIEGFITEYLGLPIQYECFAELDPTKIGFLADGRTPLWVKRGGKTVSVTFPKDTIVIERGLCRPEESGRRRFVLAHEAAHKVLERHIPAQTGAPFRSDYNSETKYSLHDLRRMFSINEALTNRLGAAVIMPLFLVEKALKKFNGGDHIVCYDGGVMSQKDKLTMKKMADGLGVSFSALFNRMKELELMDYRPLEEYIENDLGFGMKGGN